MRDNFKGRPGYALKAAAGGVRRWQRTAELAEAAQSLAGRPGQASAGPLEPRDLAERAVAARAEGDRLLRSEAFQRRLLPGLIDNGLSGGQINTPAYAEALERARRGESVLYHNYVTQPDLAPLVAAEVGRNPFVRPYGVHARASAFEWRDGWGDEGWAAARDAGEGFEVSGRRMVAQREYGIEFRSTRSRREDLTEAFGQSVDKITMPSEIEDMSDGPDKAAAIERAVRTGRIVHPAVWFTNDLRGPTAGAVPIRTLSVSGAPDSLAFTARPSAPAGTFDQGTTLVNPSLLGFVDWAESSYDEYRREQAKMKGAA